MKLIKRIEIMSDISSDEEVYKDIPFQVSCIFPDIQISNHGTISFSINGDFVTPEQAIKAMKYLIKQLKDEK